MCSDRLYEDQLRDEVMRCLREGCPNIPDAAVESLSLAATRQFETNRVSLDLIWCAPGVEANPEWKIEVQAHRQNFLQPWSVSSIRVSSACIDKDGCSDGLP